MAISLNDKVLATRRLAVIGALSDIQQRIVSFHCNGFHLESWYDERITSAMKDFDARLEDLVSEFQAKLKAE